MFSSLAEIVSRAESTGRPIWRIVLDEEVEDADTTGERVLERLGERLATMREAVERGLHSDAPSVSGAGRRGGRLRRGADRSERVSPFWAVVARASHDGVNARMGTIVRLPRGRRASPGGPLLRRGGLGLSETISFAGSRMRAWAGDRPLASRRGGRLSGRPKRGRYGGRGDRAARAAPPVSESVAFTLQGMLGLICDPVGGLVEVPCLTRNVSGAVQAVAGSELALAGLHFPIPADEVIDVMGQIGNELDEKYRETAKGGLAAGLVGGSPPRCGGTASKHERRARRRIRLGPPTRQGIAWLTVDPDPGRGRFGVLDAKTATCVIRYAPDGRACWIRSRRADD
jgi:L-serine dehydratase